MTRLLLTVILTTWHMCSAAEHNCTTTVGDPGTCVALDSCPVLVDMSQTNPSDASFLYMQMSSCEGPHQYNVCCPETSGAVQKCQLTAFPPESSSECCGVDASGGGNRIVECLPDRSKTASYSIRSYNIGITVLTGGSITAIEEYPWMALIEYTHNNTIYLLCGGALISGRYVLTAGHCIAGPVLTSGTPVKVRLGEYDTSNPGPDCVQVEGGGEDCTDGPVSIRIEKIVPHPDYKPNSKLKRNDIALIRLLRVVQFTDFIRPICLPTADFTITAQSAELMLYTAGWGAVSEFQRSSEIKLKVGLPYLSYKKCQPSYNVPGRRVKLWEGQMCAGGVIGKDSCNGDSGGPLIRENGGFFELVGVVSFGPGECGKERIAGVYTKVFYYVPWIRSQIVA